MHLIGVAVGVAVVLFISLGVLIAIIRTRAASHHRQPPEKALHHHSTEEIQDQEIISSTVDPDVILLSTG